ncbi:zinc finger BED domain-containing protein 4 [Elysia marginata]|uniref:Zinc finger BED domain-containing protein 4 n=1 Tax=Elysia marginata TaxID=1093978 RepID=A0AAV4GGM2_9GAST|nr:zinc finger BED domain-containing protein 4 [Elysia marginata]
MTKHLEKNHAITYTQAVADRAKENESVAVAPQPRATSSLVQQTVVEAYDRNRPYDNKSNRKLAIDQALLHMIVGDLQPFSVVEDKWFRNLLRILDSRYQLPSRRTVTRTLLPELYKQEKARVKGLLDTSDSVSLTTDIWTSRRTQAFITVTAHFVSNDWKLHSVVLATVRMTESHTAVNIKDELEAVIHDWGLQEKVFAIVTDNASNMVAAVNLLKVRHVPCYAHTLNLVVNDTLKELPHLSALRKKVRGIVSHFHSSVKSSEELEQAQRQQGADPLKLIIEVDTRWNSTFYMFERYLKLHKEVTTALCLVGKKDMCLEEVDMVHMKEAVDALQPFAMATTEMSGEKFTTLSFVVPMVQMLHECLCEFSSTNPVSSQLQAQLRKRFPSPETAFIWAAATYMDPRFMRHGFTDAGNAKEVEEKLKKRMGPTQEEADRQQTAEKTASPVCSTSGLWSKYDAKVKTILATSTKSSVQPDMELRRFKEEQPIPRHEDPLQWWQSFSQSSPRMGKLARKYLSCPATSVPSERLFSKAGELVCQRRAAIGENNIDMVLFLNKNLP